MTIKTVLNTISEQEIENIIDYYNNIKPPKFGLLDIVLCKEGGFQIINNAITNNNKFIGYFIKENDKNRQLRWNKKYLVNYCNIPPFHKEEEELLYKSMQFVLGKENVSNYDSYGSAVLDSPSIRTKNSPPSSQKIYNYRRVFPI
jgi:hypothetical protein